MSAEDIAEDTRAYVIECSNALSEISDLLGQLLAVERARAEHAGITLKHQLNCGGCGFPISSNDEVCGDCKINRAVAARAEIR